MNRLSLILLFCLMGLNGCIRKEPLNKEADIVKMILPAGISKTEPKITNEEVVAFLLPGKADVSKLAPQFELSPGAIISPASGTQRDFSKEQTYTVTSEDGYWKKTYVVRISTDDIPTFYGFENWQREGKFENPYELVQGGVAQNIWASGNAGFSLVSGKNAKPEDFPTASSTASHTGRYAAKLVTRSTGPWGQAAGMRIAAGNLFIGSFDGGSAMTKPLEATHFGLPFGRKPVGYKGYYRYASGGNVVDSLGNILDRRDIGQIYAVLYETDETVKYLNGGNILSSPNIVALADVQDLHETSGSEYTFFNVKFDYNNPNRPFDPQKMAAYKYNLAVVFTASREGAHFRGAENSTLYVDDVEIICE